MNRPHTTAHAQLEQEADQQGEGLEDGHGEALSAFAT
jgi:hypothetical protein